MAFVEKDIQHGNGLPANHFLSLQRPDTSTLAAHDFDLDNRTGFMPPQPPISRLPEQWELWETLLDDGKDGRISLGSIRDPEYCESWRKRIREMSILSVEDIDQSEPVLRRAHHVLAFLLHMYIHSLPSDHAVKIPSSLSIPLLNVSKHLEIPPVLTYSDVVLYNWDLLTASNEPTPALDNLRSQDLFSGTSSEAEFFLVSARIELHGVKALDLMRNMMDEAFVGDSIAVRRITGYLGSLASVIKELQELLMSLKERCTPDVFYNEVRPWLAGEDSNGSRKWEWPDIEDYGFDVPTELSGGSNGQSTLVHALDIFLGTDGRSQPDFSSDPPSKSSVSLLDRMRTYMPRFHRNFIAHLQCNPRPIRNLVLFNDDPKLMGAYNEAVDALKELRSSHIVIVALFIIGPARRLAAGLDKSRMEEAVKEDEKEPLRGTGGTELVKFLKGIRDRTAGAAL